jgi:hypothetical protein
VNNPVLELGQRRQLLGLLEWVLIFTLAFLLLAYLGSRFISVDAGELSLTALKLAFAYFFVTAGTRMLLSVVDWFKRGSEYR